MRKANQTNKVVGLFLVATLTVATGCSSDQVYSNEDDCFDDNNDGYCDDDGSSVGSSYIDYDGRRRYKKQYSGVSSGKSSGFSSAAKGGIGSSGYSSSG